MELTWEVDTVSNLFDHKFSVDGVFKGGIRKQFDVNWRLQINNPAGRTVISHFATLEAAKARAEEIWSAPHAGLNFINRSAYRSPFGLDADFIMIKDGKHMVGRYYQFEMLSLIHLNGLAPFAINGSTREQTEEVIRDVFKIVSTEKMRGESL